MTIRVITAIPPEWVCMLLTEVSVHYKLGAAATTHHLTEAGFHNIETLTVSINGKGTGNGYRFFFAWQPAGRCNKKLMEDLQCAVYGFNETLGNFTEVYRGIVARIELGLITKIYLEAGNDGFICCVCKELVEPLPVPGIPALNQPPQKTQPIITTTSLAEQLPETIPTPKSEEPPPTNTSPKIEDEVTEETLSPNSETPKSAPESNPPQTAKVPKKKTLTKKSSGRLHRKKVRRMHKGRGTQAQQKRSKMPVRKLPRAHWTPKKIPRVSLLAVAQSKNRLRNYRDGLLREISQINALIGDDN